MIKLLVSGDRWWDDYGAIEDALSFMPDRAVTLIHGCAQGADTLAHAVAQRRGWIIDQYPADWDKHGKAAGPIRNRLMLDQCPDLVVAFHHDIVSSKGTKDCVTEAKKRGTPVVLVG